MLGGPPESSDCRLALRFQNRNLTDQASNSPFTFAGLFTRDLSQRFVRDTLHEPRAKQRRSDEPVTNILAWGQRRQLWCRSTHGLRRDQRTAGRWYEFFVGSKMSCADFGYGSTSAG